MVRRGRGGLCLGEGEGNYSFPALSRMGCDVKCKMLTRV